MERLSLIVVVLVYYFNFVESLVCEQVPVPAINQTSLECILGKGYWVRRICVKEESEKLNSLPPTWVQFSHTLTLMNMNTRTFKVHVYGFTSNKPNQVEFRLAEYEVDQRLPIFQFVKYLQAITILRANGNNTYVDPRPHSPAIKLEAIIYVTTDFNMRVFISCDGKSMRLEVSDDVQREYIFTGNDKAKEYIPAFEQLMVIYNFEYIQCRDMDAKGFPFFIPYYRNVTNSHTEGVTSG